jgi:hypothetical protein
MFPFGLGRARHHESVSLRREIDPRILNLGALSDSHTGSFAPLKFPLGRSCWRSGLYGGQRNVCLAENGTLESSVVSCNQFLYRLSYRGFNVTNMLT